MRVWRMRIDKTRDKKTTVCFITYLLVTSGVGEVIFPRRPTTYTRVPPPPDKSLPRTVCPTSPPKPRRNRPETHRESSTPARPCPNWFAAFRRDTGPCCVGVPLRRRVHGQTRFTCVHTGTTWSQETETVPFIRLPPPRRYPVNGNRLVTRPARVVNFVFFTPPTG